ncbi:MAG: S8 family serine peptidase, partial [Acidimicrobiales bacterium]
MLAKRRLNRTWIRLVAKTGVAIATFGIAMIVLSTPALSTTSPNVTASGNSENLVGIRQNSDGTLTVIEVGADTFLAADDSLLALEPEIEVSGFRVATDPRRASQWSFDATTIEAAWDNGTGRGTKVAILDSGLRTTHEDLRGAILTGVDFISPNGGDGSGPDFFHGTHVAGIVAARRDNGVGIAGVAPDSKILPVRVLNYNGSGTSTNVARGIIWSVEHGADVINLSLGGDVESTVITTAINYALDNGVVVVAA